MIAPIVLLQKADATAVVRERQRVLVGRSDGTLEGYDAADLKPAYRYRSGAGAIRWITWANGSAWWAGAGSNDLWHVEGATDTARAVSAARLGLGGPVVGLSEWRKKVLVQTDAGYAFLDPRSGDKVADFFPPPVADVASQGQIAASWDDRIGGSIFVVRRAEKLTKAREKGGTTDVAAITGFHCTPKGRWTELGTYYAPVAPFRDAEGRGTTIRISSSRTITAPRGVVDLRSFLVQPQGLVALMKRQVLYIPFSEKNWEPRTFSDLALDPEYSPTATLIQNRLLYTRGGKIGEIDLESGEKSVQTTTRQDRFNGLLAMPEGLVTLNGPEVRLNLDYVAPGRLRYDVQGDRSRMNTEQRALLAKLDSPEFSLALGRNGEEAFRVLATAAFGRKAETRIRGAAPVQDLEFGDVLRTGERRAVYLGGGDALELSRTGTIFRKIDEIADWTAVRVAREDAVPVARIRPGSVGVVGRPDDVQYDLVLRPLGRGGTLRLSKDPKYNRPWHPKHAEMIRFAESWIGTPYVWGGKGRGGADCSGFVGAVFRHLGYRIPTFSTAIARSGLGRPVTDEVRYGDVLYIERPNRHVGIYVGNGRTIEATPAYCRYLTRPALLRNPVMVTRFIR